MDETINGQLNISINTDYIRRLKRTARDRDMSVSGLVRDIIIDFYQREGEFARKQQALPMEYVDTDVETGVEFS
jgi:hypothetical protein